jgi:hypothetical protein
MDLAKVATELYGLRPDGFTAARNDVAARARAEGDTELAAAVKALRRPTNGGWVLNLLARRQREKLAAVVELGSRLRDAVGVLSATELHSLDRRRRELTRSVAARGASLAEEAGQRVSAQVVAGVEESLRSAMVDATAGQALLSGLLVDTFTTTGLEPVPLGRVLALPDLDLAVSGDGADDRPSRVREAATRRLGEAQQAADHASAALEETEEALRVAGRSRRAAERELDRLRQAVDEAAGHLESARSTESGARQARDAARGRRDRAAEALTSARRTLETAE